MSGKRIKRVSPGAAAFRETGEIEIAKTAAAKHSERIVFTVNPPIAIDGWLDGTIARPLNIISI
jgi:hypothetical protein